MLVQALSPIKIHPIPFWSVPIKKTKQQQQQSHQPTSQPFFNKNMVFYINFFFNRMYSFNIKRIPVTLFESCQSLVLPFPYRAMFSVKKTELCHFFVRKLHQQCYLLAYSTFVDINNCPDVASSAFKYSYESYHYDKKKSSQLLQQVAEKWDSTSGLARRPKAIKSKFCLYSPATPYFLILATFPSEVQLWVALVQKMSWHSSALCSELQHLLLSLLPLSFAFNRNMVQVFKIMLGLAWVTSTMDCTT